MATMLTCSVLENFERSVEDDILEELYTVIRSKYDHLPALPAFQSDRRSCLKLALESLRSLLYSDLPTESTSRTYNRGELTSRENSFKEMIQDFKLEKQSFLNDLHIFRKEKRDFDKVSKENIADTSLLDKKVKLITEKLEEVKKSKIEFANMCKAQKENFKAKEVELNKWEMKLIEKEKKLRKMSMSFSERRFEEPERDSEARYKEELYKEFRQELKEVQNEWSLKEKKFEEQMRSKDSYIAMLEKQIQSTGINAKSYRRVPILHLEQMNMMKEDLLSASMRLADYEHTLYIKEESLNSLEFNLQNETQDIEDAAYMFETINQELEDKRKFLNDAESQMEKAWQEIKQANEKLRNRESDLISKEQLYKERLHKLETREALVKEKKKGLKKLEKVLESRSSSSFEFSPYIEHYEKRLSQQREEIAREKLEIQKAKLELMHLRSKGADFLSTDEAAFQLQRINQLLLESNGISLLAPLSSERLSIK
jgi:hypothetical protein